MTHSRKDNETLGMEYNFKSIIANFETEYENKMRERRERMTELIDEIIEKVTAFANVETELVHEDRLKMRVRKELHDF